jgi:hypothetical protein
MKKYTQNNENIATIMGRRKTRNHALDQEVDEMNFKHHRMSYILETLGKNK